MATELFKHFTKDQKMVCRQIAGERGPVAIYARMAIAYAHGVGIRLSAEDVADLSTDESNLQALAAEIESMLDKGRET